LLGDLVLADNVVQTLYFPHENDLLVTSSSHPMWSIFNGSEQLAAIHRIALDLVLVVYTIRPKSVSVKEIVLPFPNFNISSAGDDSFFSLSWNPSTTCNLLSMCWSKTSDMLLIDCNGENLEIKKKVHLEFAQGVQCTQILHS